MCLRPVAGGTRLAASSDARGSTPLASVLVTVPSGERARRIGCGHFHRSRLQADEVVRPCAVGSRSALPSEYRPLGPFRPCASNSAPWWGVATG